MRPFTGSPFREKEFYRSLGLKVGLEVHQQLLTAKKLFCRCPAGKYSDDYHAAILRHMRPTLSELGEYDGTALMEFRTRKEIVYRLNNESVCTYEMDDSPPFQIDESSVSIALEVAMLLQCNIVGEIHISRKQYLDGSIPTGFQRTTVVGLNGTLPVNGKTVRVVQLGLEEDACREVEDVGHRRIYRTDRLGMPLIEVVTAPELCTPYEAYQAAQAIRMINRSTGKVRTGIGAARQDVNVSIEGGTRVEIKGVSRIPRIPYLVHSEAIRQRSLLDIRDELKRRGLEKSSVKETRILVNDLLEKTSFAPIRKAMEKGWEVRAIKFNGFSGLFKRAIQPGRSFVREFSDRVRVVACLDVLPNIACSDFEKDGLSRDEWIKIKRVVRAVEDDAVILVWGCGEDLVTACEEIEQRAREAFEGVPSETRQALVDNTNGFERILPGPDRMYPDTDLPPKKITEERIESIRLKPGITAPMWKEKVRSFKLCNHLSWGLFRLGYAELFLKLAKQKTLPAAFAASILVDKLSKLDSKGKSAPQRGEIEQVFCDLSEGKISKDEVKRWAEGDGFSLSACKSKSHGKGGISKSRIEKELRFLIGKIKPKSSSPTAMVNFYIGEIKSRLGVSGRSIYEILVRLPLFETEQTKEKE